MSEGLYEGDKTVTRNGVNPSPLPDRYYHEITGLSEIGPRVTLVSLGVYGIVISGTQGKVVD